MAGTEEDKKIRLSELPESSDRDGLYVLGINKLNESVKAPFGKMLDSVTPIVLSEEQYENLAEKDNNQTYFTYED